MQLQKLQLTGVVFVWLLVAALLLAGCGDGSQTEKDVNAESAVQVEASSSSQANSYFESSSEQGTTSSGSSAEDEISTTETQSIEKQETEISADEEETGMKMTVEVGDSTFTATLEDNAAGDALREMLEEGPVTIEMSDYSGFEKVGSLGTSLPASNSQMTTESGDIVLYNNSQIVIFYGSNSWSYTKLGHIDDLTGWEEALGSGDVEVTFSA